MYFEYNSGTNTIEQTSENENKQTEQTTPNNVIDSINDYIIKTNNAIKFSGVIWIPERQKWKAEFQYKAKRMFLGYFVDQIDAAKTYNDYALYLNETESANLILNEIPGYQTISRNIPELNKSKKNNSKSSKYNGVSYDTQRRCYVAGIKFCKKTYNLGNHQHEIECAKLYNQQALFFNNTFNTKYELNDIENYVTIPKDLREIIKPTKTSSFHGVSKTRTGKWACSYVMNKKKVHIGTYETELDACNAYNKVVSELNKNGCSYVLNSVC